MDKNFRLFHTTNPDNLSDPNGIHDYYLNIISNMPNNVYWLDKDCIAQGCNKNVLKLIGLKRLEDFVGITYEEMGKLANWTEDQAQHFKQDDMEVIVTGKPKFNIEEPPLYNGEGNPVYYISTRVPLFDKNGEVMGVIGISVDITERKKMEEQLRSKEQAEAANKAKSQFIANMSHDIRTPLTGLTGMANIIAKEAKDVATKDAADCMVRAANILLDLLNKIIELSKLEAGELPVYEVKFSMKHLVDNVASLIMPSIKQKNLNLVINYDNSTPPYLIGDSIRIDRILLNLIGNAIKFTHKGFIEISVAIAKRHGQKIILRLTVKDSGIGIPAEKQGIIFSKFDKLNPSYTGTYKGYGLGLSIVKQFISELEGEIYVKSKEGDGSIFTCLIPLKESLLEDAEDETELPYPSAEAHLLHLELKEDNLDKQHITKSLVNDAVGRRKQALTKYKVLLVEDNELAQKVAKHHLEALDCQVDIAGTGEEALELSQRASYDLIFMDVGLPGKSGIEITSEIRKLETNEHSYTPIIALTAHIDKDSKQACLQAGMDEVLTKPLNEQKAQELLKQYVKIKKGAFMTKHQTTFTIDQSIKAIDLELSQKLLGCTNKLAKEALDMFMESLPETRDIMLKAYHNKDLKMLEFHVHKFYGGTCYCGVPRVKAVAEQLELALKAKNKKIDYINALYNLLMEEIKNLEKAFDKFDKPSPA